ncbi:hypothetical protein BJ508DRAFT_334812 [Ascobolus immersus RN42]|uniref:Uncharacterized protein n=1 Tax=Ascobolus immersus RN42 TaxID=1160509 RepID=A0A3N4HKM7_ASCIM|nr:hypothetical protein BJ508DRAFT_334812 [Ascobolus immersus RN42]
MQQVTGRVQHSEELIEKLRAAQSNFGKDEAIQVISGSTLPYNARRAQSTVTLEEAALRGGLWTIEEVSDQDREFRHYIDSNQGWQDAFPGLKYPENPEFRLTSTCIAVTHIKDCTRSISGNFRHIPFPCNASCRLVHPRAANWLKDPGPTKPYVATMTKLAAQRCFGSLPHSCTKASYQDYPLGFSTSSSDRSQPCSSEL